MSTATEEIIRVCEALPVEKQTEVADFARFLLTRQDDERWEQLLAYPGPRPKLDAFLRDSAAEPDAPLDPQRLGTPAPGPASGALTTRWIPASARLRAALIGCF